MKSSTIWTIIVVVLICINSTILLLIWKQKKPGPPTGNQMEVKDFIIKQLSLSKSQVEKFEMLRKAHHSAVENLEEQNRVLKDNLFKNLSNPVAGGKLIDSLTGKIATNYAMIDKTTFNHFKALRSILEPAQQKKFDEIIQQALQMLSRPGPPNNQGPGDMPPPDRRRGPGRMPPPPNGPEGNDQRPEGMPPGPPPPNGK